MIVRWTFVDPISLASYTFDVNPNAGGSATAKKNLTVVPTTGADGTPLIFEGDDDLMTSEFSGVILTNAQYDAFKVWFGYNRPIGLVDDLGRISYIHLTKLAPKRAQRLQHMHRQTYTMSFNYLDRVNP